MSFRFYPCNCNLSGVCMGEPLKLLVWFLNLNAILTNWEWEIHPSIVILDLEIYSTDIYLIMRGSTQYRRRSRVEWILCLARGEFMADGPSGKRRKNTEFFVSFQTWARRAIWVICQILRLRQRPLLWQKLGVLEIENVQLLNLLKTHDSTWSAFVISLYTASWSQ